MSHDRIPPHNLEAEKATLGALLVDAKLLPVIAAVVKPSAFYAPVHEIIAENIFALDEAAKPIDKITVAESLRARGQYDRVGGIAYLSHLMEFGLEAADPKYYATLVAEKATLRRGIKAGLQIAKLCYEGEIDVDAAVREAEDALRAAFSQDIADDGKTAMQAARDIFEEIDLAVSAKKPLGVSTPFRTLDKHTGGFQPGEVIVVAGAPGMGKSAFAVQCAEYAALQHGDTAIFALEMGCADTVRRMIASRANVNVRNMRRGSVTPREMESIGSALDQFSRLPMHFYDASRPKSVADIRRIARNLKDRSGLSMIVVDHPGFLADVMQRGRMSKHEILELCYQNLKALAAELQIVVMIVQHINRAGMDREPTLADLRDGGNLEGIAHIVIFPYRPNLIDSPELGELVVAKNRDGEPGRIPAGFGGARFQWSEKVLAA